MGRKYTITFTEDETTLIHNCMTKECQTDTEPSLIASICAKIIQAKQKPYTNFDKIKDEIVLDDILKIYGDTNGRWCKANCKVDKSNYCAECCKRWLEREVKE